MINIFYTDIQRIIVGDPVMSKDRLGFTARIELKSKSKRSSAKNEKTIVMSRSWLLSCIMYGVDVRTAKNLEAQYGEVLRYVLKTQDNIFKAQENKYIRALMFGCAPSADDYGTIIGNSIGDKNSLCIITERNNILSTIKELQCSTLYVMARDLFVGLPSIYSKKMIFDYWGAFNDIYQYGSEPNVHSEMVWVRQGTTGYRQLKDGISWLVESIRWKISEIMNLDRSVRIDRFQDKAYHDSMIDYFEIDMGNNAKSRELMIKAYDNVARPICDDRWFLEEAVDAFKPVFYPINKVKETADILYMCIRLRVALSFGLSTKWKEKHFTQDADKYIKLLFGSMDIDCIRNKYQQIYVDILNGPTKLKSLIFSAYKTSFDIIDTLYYTGKTLTDVEQEIRL